LPFFEFKVKKGKGEPWLGILPWPHVQAASSRPLLPYRTPAGLTY
jgi:hypothetical protein